MSTLQNSEQLFEEAKKFDIEKMLSMPKMPNIEKPKVNSRVNPKKRQAKLPKGTYPFVITDYSINQNIQTRYSISDIIKIDFIVFVEDLNGNISEVRIQKSVYINDGNLSQLEKFVSELGLEYDETGFDLNELLGIQGLAEVDHYTNEKENTYERVAKVFQCFK